MILRRYRRNEKGERKCEGKGRDRKIYENEDLIGEEKVRWRLKEI